VETGRRPDLTDDATTPMNGTNQRRASGLAAFPCDACLIFAGGARPLPL